ncbi:extracellular solute-binding protein [Chitinibacter sp. SCUT-21]|uniref:extracellular solute-binding protein n=1 Tax=Chitinibacter sp. SCUT-21 TaxID=2970891 RepID=UPI0035A7082C
MRLHSLLSFICLSLLALSANAAQVLRVLSWPGYAEPEQVRQFEAKYDAKLEITIVGGDDELWLKASKNKGQNYDVIALNTAILQTFIDQGLVQAINPKQIPNLKYQLPRFRQIASLSRNKQQYAVPYTYSEMGLIYNRKLVKSPPQSISELWNPTYRDQVLIFNGSAHNFSLAAMQLGYSNPFQLSDKQIANSTKKLVDLRQNVFKFYNTPEEATRLFTNNQIALIHANFGHQQVMSLRKAGADIAYIIPKEGALAWLDCWAILAGAKNMELAHQWINFTLNKEMSQQLINKQGLNNTRQESQHNVDHRKLIWLEPVENATERSNLWSRVVSGHKK